MFCVLSVRERNETLFEKLFGRLMADEYSVSTIPVFKGAPFFILNVVTNKREIDWENVIFAVGKCSSRLITSGKIKISENHNVGIFKSGLLYEKMMKNTIIQILENNKNGLYPISVLDNNADNTDFVKKLSSFASTLTISTQNREKYLKVCDEITEMTGMCPILKSDFEDAKIKINTDELVMTVCNQEGNMNIYEGEDFKVPSQYENLLPDDIDKYDFYSALYELCGVFSLGECLFDIITVNNEKKRVQDIHFS